MFGLLLLIVFWLIVPLAVEGFALHFAAGVAKSSRATAGRTLVAVVGLALLGIASAVISQKWVRPQPSESTVPVWTTPQEAHDHATQFLVKTVKLFGAMAVVYFIFISRVYELPFERSFIPFGMFIASQLLIVAYVVYLIRPYVFDGNIVPTGSMQPTLEIGDRVVANKLERFHRGDLMTYRAVKNVLYVKRLVGLPGDRLRFESPDFFIDGDSKPYCPPASVPIAAKIRNGERFKYPDGTTITLGPDDYFMVGDHLQTSYDSRYVGPSHRIDLVGVVDMIYWPPKRIKFFR